MGGELSPVGTGNRRCSSLSLFNLLLLLALPLCTGNTAGEERTGGGDGGWFLGQ